MLNCIFYSIFFALFLDMSFGSLRFSQINRAFMSTYKGMYEASVVTVDNNGDPIFPYFNQTTLTNYVNTFLAENLNRYATNYTLNVDFYEKDGITKCDKKGLARNVKINLKADINFLYKYDKQKSFSIKEKESV